ncbi:carboxypeptidase-like regulatory domain-containing protein [Mucilaginibacter mallensis]|nr:carboxypeptidase-like regulatory domain-containing protein [Mucilaginibacter mallensis]
MDKFLRKRKAIALLFFLPLLYLGVSAQAQTSTTSSQSIIDKTARYNDSLPTERLYLHLDKSYYSAGDTIWFKGYLINSALAYSPLSSRLYVDLINDHNKVVRHLVFPISFGLTLGNIYLDESLVHEGAYTIRAYTNWMRNFGPDQLFYTNLYVAASGSDSLLVNANSTLSANHLKIDLKFTGPKNQPSGVHDLQVKLADDKKTWQTSNAQTSASGDLNLDFDLPDNVPVKNLTLIAQDKKTNTTKLIPVNVTRTADIDLQFMPEGGQLVESLPTHIGFKAIGEDGKGINIKGVLIDKENNEEVSFESYHNGMGAFDFVPLPGEKYTAKITLPDGGVKTVNLPVIKTSGTLLKIKNNASDSLEVSVLATKDMQSATNDYTIIGQSRGAIYYAATFKLNKDYATFYVPKSSFPTGIAHFTLFNAQNQPLNERMSFINHHDNLKVEINSNAASYAPRDSIPVHITVKDDKGNPVVGSFSLSVTDDGQIKNTDINKTNILTQLLLSADLKGYVEDPAWYFSADNKAAKALDILLLTQGWIGYDWKDILNGPAQPAFDAEPQYMLKGKVVNVLGKPIANSNVTLLSTGKIKLYKDTTSDSRGQFTFKNFPLITDSIAFVLQARNAKGRIVNAGITVKDDDIPLVSLPYFPPPVPWYVNSDSTALNYINKSAAYHDALDGLKNGPGNHLLKTVNIKDRAVIKGSKNLNGAGSYDQAITQDEIVKAGKISLLKLIEQKVNSFHEGYGAKGNNLAFMLKDKRVHFSIDGIDIDRFYEKSDNSIPNDHYYYQKEILEYFTAEDITGIEVIYSTRFTALYDERNLPDGTATPPTARAGEDVAYLEITTRSGQGPYANRSTGIFVYKPVPITVPAQFYSPKYVVKNMYPRFTDLRSTIYWEPNIVTNKAGEAKTVFYAADPLTTYTIVLQGADLNGKVGYTTHQITIASKK